MNDSQWITSCGHAATRHRVDRAWTGDGQPKVAHSLPTLCPHLPTAVAGLHASKTLPQMSMNTRKASPGLLLPPPPSWKPQPADDLTAGCRPRPVWFIRRLICRRGEIDIPFCNSGAPPERPARSVSSGGLIPAPSGGPKVVRTTRAAL